MKNLKTLLLIAVFTLGVGGVANAQKIAHIDYQKVIFNMPEARTLQNTIEKLAKTYQNEIEGMAKKMDDKAKKYTAEQNAQTKEINETRALEVQQDRARFEQLRQTAVKDLKDREVNGLSPISEKALKTIEEVATSKGILYVFDANTLLIKKGEDLYDAVKTKLGLLEDRVQTQPKN